MLQAVASCISFLFQSFDATVSALRSAVMKPGQWMWRVSQQVHCRTSNTVNVLHRCRICAEGARFAEKVLQSEPTHVDPLEDAGTDSDDAESECAVNDSPASQPPDASATASAAAVPTHAVGEPPSESHHAIERLATHAVGDNGRAAALSTSDSPAAVTNPQQAVGNSAELAVSGVADTAVAAASESHGGYAAGAPILQTPAEDSPMSAGCQVAPAASELSKPEAADAAVSAAAPHAVSEADEQFEVLCRALLAASQLIATVTDLFWHCMAERQPVTQGREWR